MKYALDSILHVKNFAAEFLKDSPLVIYLAFYEPFHSWLFHVADEWNPILKFFFNILMLAAGNWNTITRMCGAAQRAGHAQ